MNETIKTSIFLVLAAALVGLAVMARPVVRPIKMEEMVSKPLFPMFIDPLAVKKLEIAKLDPAGNLDDFRIAEVNGVWSIPSHDNYPADAKDQMGKVAEALVDLKVIEVVATLENTTDTTTLHAMYGVIDPTSEQAMLGEGIGVKVKMIGADEKPLVDLIIGKEVDAKEKKKPDDMMPEESGKLRYARIAGQVPVYVVEIDPKRFSTSFDQWIEKNLLDISTMNIKQILIDEYSLKIEMEAVRSQGAIIPREVIVPTFTGDLLLDYNSSATGPEKWKLNKMMGFRGQKYEYYEMSMKPDEELDAVKLDGMVSALNDLKIVSVAKKPSVFATALKTGKSLESIEPDPSLKRNGFYLVPMPDLKGGTGKKVKQLLSNEGDIQLRLKDGIRYNLRFGDLTGTESEIDAKDEKKDELAKDGKAKDEKTASTMGANRFLFITADFDESAIAKPELKPVPEVPAEGDKEVIENAKKLKEEVERSNQREQDRYKDELEAGKKRAQKLTERFADWYYVIPEDVYKKIHLNRTNLFRPKKVDAAKDHEHGPDCDCPEHAKPGLPTLPGLGDMIKTPETKVEEPKKDEPAPKPAEEPSKKDEPAAKPAEEPKKDEPAPKPAEEPKKDEPAPKPAEEPKKDEPAPKPAEEPKKDEPAPKPAEEPKKDEPAPKPAEEPKKDEPKKDEPKPEEKKDEKKDGDKVFDPFGGMNPSE